MYVIEVTNKILGTRKRRTATPYMTEAEARDVASAEAARSRGFATFHVIDLSQRGGVCVACFKGQS